MAEGLGSGDMWLSCEVVLRLSGSNLPREAGSGTRLPSETAKRADAHVNRAIRHSLLYEAGSVPRHAICSLGLSKSIDDLICSPAHAAVEYRKAVIVLRVAQQVALRLEDEAGGFNFRAQALRINPMQRFGVP